MEFSNRTVYLACKKKEKSASLWHRLKNERVSCHSSDLCGEEQLNDIENFSR